jgi:hypothetical protein
VWALHLPVEVARADSRRPEGVAGRQVIPIENGRGDLSERAAQGVPGDIETEGRGHMSIDSRLNLFSATLENFKEPAVHRHARHSREGHAFDIEVSAPILEGLRASERENRKSVIADRKEGLSLVLVEDLHQPKSARREECL